MNNLKFPRKIIVTSIFLLLANNAIASNVQSAATNPDNSIKKCNNNKTTQPSVQEWMNGPQVNCSSNGSSTNNNPNNKPVNKPVNKPGNKPANKPGNKPANKPTSNPTPTAGRTPVNGIPVGIGTAVYGNKLGSAPAIGTAGLVASASTNLRTPFIATQDANGYYLYYAAKPANTTYCGKELPTPNAYWIRGIDFNTRFGEAVGAPDWIALNPNEIISYEVTIPQSALGRAGGFAMNEATYSRQVGFNVSVSKIPCDFHPADGIWAYNNKSYNVCSDNTGLNGPVVNFIYTKKGDTKPKETYLHGGILDRTPICKLEVGSTYYINIRIPPVSIANPSIDRCEESRRGFASGSMGSENTKLANDLTCGGIIKFQ